MVTRPLLTAASGLDGERPIKPPTVDLGSELGVRVAKVKPDLPILFMSGYIDPTIGPSYQTSDPELIVQKPFSRKDLLARVRDALDRITR